MKLLFDANVSHRLVKDLASEYPGSTHHARTYGFTIVSKDTDFRERSYVEGFPPKVIWLDVANAGTAAIAALLKRERERIERFDTSAEASLLILSIGASAV